MAKALALLNAGCPDAAMNEISAVLAADPECRLAHRVLGAALVRKEQYGEALLAYQRGAMVEDPHWHSERAICLGRMGRHDEAVVSAKQAVRIAPDNAIAWYRVGALLCVAGRKTTRARRRKMLLEGEAALRRAILLDPTSHLPRVDLAHLYLTQGRAGAEPLINEALRLRFGEPCVHQIAGEWALRCGRLEEAASHAEIVVRSRPDAPEAIALALRVRRAQSSRLYKGLQRLGWLVMRGPTIYVLAVIAGIAGVLAGMTRAQFNWSCVAVMGIACGYFALSHYRLRQALRQPRLSTDF